MVPLLLLPASLRLLSVDIVCGLSGEKLAPPPDAHAPRTIYWTAHSTVLIGRRDLLST